MKNLIEWVSKYLPESVKLAIGFSVLFIMVLAVDANAKEPTTIKHINHSVYVVKPSKADIRAKNFGVSDLERILPTVKPWEHGKFDISECRGIKNPDYWDYWGLLGIHYKDWDKWKCQSVHGRETMEDFVYYDGMMVDYGVDLNQDYPKLIIKYRTYIE